MAPEQDLSQIEFSYLWSKEVVVAVLCSNLVFCALFMLLYYFVAPKFIHPYFPRIANNPKKHFQIIDKSCSTIHGLIVIILCISWENVWVMQLHDEDVYGLTTTKHRIIGSISIGYFLYDTIIVCLIYSIKINGKPDYMYLFHHFVSVGELIIVLIITVYSGFVTVFPLFLHEVTNPLLHIPTIIRIIFNHRSDNIYYIIILSLYLILFCFARFVIFGHVVYQVVFVYDELNITFKILTVPLLILSLVLLPGTTKSLIRKIKSYKNDTYNYSEVVQQSSQSEIDTEIESDAVNNMNVDETYDEILAKSIQSVKYCFILGIAYSFFHTNRMSIYILYANEFSPTQNDLYLLLYGFSFWNGLAALIYSSLGNQYGFDFMLTILLFLQCVGVLLEAVAQNFLMLLMGILIAQVAITHVILGYIAWILPHKLSKIYTSYFYASFAVSYLLGPGLSGVTSYYLSNRMVFIINLIVVVMVFVYCFFIIRNSQKNIEQQQLSLHIIENKENDEQFPICLEEHKRENNDFNEMQLNWYQMPKLLPSHWIMLISIIYIKCTIDLCENSFMLYYALYVVSDLNGTVYEGTLGIVVMSTAFIIANLSIPILFEKFNIKSIKSILWVIIINICALIAIMYLFSAIKSLTFFWINDALLGFPFGFLSMSAETAILIIQPTKYSGKVSGVKGLMANWLQAFDAVIIAIWWQTRHIGLFYTIIICWIVGLIIAFLMLYTNQTWKHPESEKSKEQELQRVNDD